MSDRAAEKKVAKGKGKRFACLVEGCGVERRCEPELFGHMVFFHHKAVDKVVDVGDGSVRRVVRDAVLGDVKKAWQDCYREGGEELERRRAENTLDEWGQSLTKRDLKRGMERGKREHRRSLP